MEQFNTPMMKQYEAIKAKYPDCLLFYRMGDFYELFLEDAYIGAKILSITLTSKQAGKNTRIPMAGIPYHAVDSYLSKLIKAGFKVAICEQVSLPNKYGLVDREVVRVVTPGTVLDEKALEKKDHNYIISIAIENEQFAIAAADLSTGFLGSLEKSDQNLSQGIREELAKLNPTECILAEKDYNNPEILKILKSETNLNLYPYNNWITSSEKGWKMLCEHFGVSTLVSFSIEKHSLKLQALASILDYFKQTQKNAVKHIRKISPLDANDHVLLDRSTILNLELFSTIREHDSRGTLLNVLDETVTSMGGRMLKNWLLKPLLGASNIEERLDAVENYLNSEQLRESNRELLKQIPDVERILSRLSLGLGNPRDLINLKNALKTINQLKEQNCAVNTKLIQSIIQQISPETQNVIDLIDLKLVEEPPIDCKGGGLIREGINQELDRLRNTISGSKKWMVELEQKERERTGINSLKVRFNKVFGFYIEISKSNLSSIPDNYIRKQTLVNGERFITEELKKHEEIILTAEEKINQLEYQIFLQSIDQVMDNSSSIQDAAEAVAIFDCILSLSFLAFRENYTRPKLNKTGEIKLLNSRHPVVEKLLDEGQFVPNDLLIGGIHHPLHLITGPNMAGKSVFIRQVALILLMAQIGSFVPAEKAELSLVDRIFVRSGASDVITSGLSTFMVEMVETAYILNNATKDSLIVMDEIGRGTSTYDGISIAWAVAEYLANHFPNPPKTLFATHYHELQNLDDYFPNFIKNYSMAVAEHEGHPVFLYTLVEGGASSSFGIAVARLAGVPMEVITKAQDKLISLEVEKKDIIETPTYEKITFQDIDLFDRLILKELEGLEIHEMTPLDALNKLSEMKNKLKLLLQNHDRLQVN